MQIHFKLVDTYISFYLYLISPQQMVRIKAHKAPP